MKRLIVVGILFLFATSMIASTGNFLLKPPALEETPAVHEAHIADPGDYVFTDGHFVKIQDLIDANKMPCGVPTTVLNHK